MTEDQKQKIKDAIKPAFDSIGVHEFDINFFFDKKDCLRAWQVFTGDICVIAKESIRYSLDYDNMILEFMVTNFNSMLTGTQSGEDMLDCTSIFAEKNCGLPDLLFCSKNEIDNDERTT